MCGLVGVAGNLDSKSDRMFKLLLHFDAVRGEHSTGVAFIHKNGDVKIVKAVGNPYELMDKTTFQNNINKMNRVLIGHNRFATQGQVNLANAHPFEYGKIVGAHNGTLQNKHVLENGYKFDVDSQALFNHINEHGIVNAIDKLNGAWSLTWWNGEEETINFLRNKERPMNIAFSKDGKYMFWASEKWMLEVASLKAEIPLKHIGFLEENSHVSVKIDEKGAISDWKDREVKSNAVPFVIQQDQCQPKNGQTYLTQHRSTPAHIKREFKPLQQQQSRVAEAIAANVVELRPGEKKEDTFNDSYAGSKNVRVLGTGLGRDHYGGTYIELKDVKEIGRSIRLYVNKPQEHDRYINKWFLVDIGKKFWNKDEGFYYKSSVAIEKAAEEVEPFEDSSPIGVNRFPDAKGNLVEESKWRKEHGKCDWCDVDIDPTDPHQFTRGGQILCQDCMKNEEVARYI